MWLSSDFLMNKNKGKNIKENNYFSAGKVTHNVFPAGLKVLLAGDDPMSVCILESMLQTCLYQVCICSHKERVPSLLQEDKGKFDIVIIDSNMTIMDDFNLVKIIANEMDMPVVLISPDDRKEVVMKGIVNGACQYLIKPVRIEAIKLIWQHVVRKRKTGSSLNLNRLSDENLLKPETSNGKRLKRLKDYDEYEKEISHDDGSSTKKQRLLWTKELHNKFLEALNELRDKAVPKKILECMQKMGVENLTRENIGSHLQKYRGYPQSRGKSKCQSGDSEGLTCSEPLKSQQPSSHARGFEGLNPKSSMDRPPVDKTNLNFQAMMTESNFGNEKEANNNNSEMHLLHEFSAPTESPNPGLLTPHVNSLGSSGQGSGKSEVCTNTPLLEAGSSTKENNVYKKGLCCSAQTPVTVPISNEKTEEHDNYFQFLSLEQNSNNIEEIPMENMSTIKSNGARCCPLTETGLNGYCVPPDSSILDPEAKSCDKPLLHDDENMDESDYEPLVYIKPVNHDDLLSRLLRQYMEAAEADSNLHGMQRT